MVFHACDTTAGLVFSNFIGLGIWLISGIVGNLAY